MRLGYQQDRRELTITTPLEADTLLVAAFEGEEHLFGLFHYRLELVSSEIDLDFQALVGQSVTVSLKRADDTPRYFNGIVARLTHTGSDAGFSHYRAELRPRLWPLTLDRDCRIFQNQSPVEIIETLLAEHAIVDYRNALSRTYHPRLYCVQYQESTYDFMARLMEEEGIFYFFEHQDGKHTLVLADDINAHADCPGVTSVPYAPDASAQDQPDAVPACALSRQVIVGQYAAADFNFETPSLSLFVSMEGSAATPAVYTYPGFSPVPYVGH